MLTLPLFPTQLYISYPYPIFSISLLNYSSRAIQYSLYKKEFYAQVSVVLKLKQSHPKNRRKIANKQLEM